MLKNMLCLLLMFVIVGCSSSGMMIARHNGKMYYNPGNCDYYRPMVENPDILICSDDGVNNNGNVLYPADEQQIAAYQYQQEETYKAIDRAGQSWRDTAESLKNNQNYGPKFIVPMHGVNGGYIMY